MTAPVILYVEDNNIDILIWEHFLEHQSVTMVPVTSVEEAKGRFDPSMMAAIIDWNLHDGEGIEVAEFIRANHPKLPIVFVSGQLTPAIENTVRRVNALGIFEKNSDPDYTKNILRLIQQSATPTS